MSDDLETTAPDVPPDAIAVIGMSGRFPGAADVAKFWRNLAGGIESVTFFSREELARSGVAPDLLDDPLYVPANAVLDGVDMFDADFFGLSPREAELTDPQHRIFLECAWEALEDSGYDAEAYGGQIGVYAGAGLSTYLLNCVLSRPDVVRSAGMLPLQLGNNKDYVPLRASYKLHLRGPSVNVNTACSSSLVAVHLACQSLIDHQCDIALAGGVGIQVPQHQGYLHSPNGILSPDGHCRAFDARAQGTVSGNGAGIVVLKRYAEALADGDSIRALILGTAINNDGGSKVGFTAPSVAGQSRVISEALAVAGVDPDALGYVEAHGTGTPLGDPIEVAALTEVFRSSTARTGFCALGSVKTNIGHLDEAAGVAGLIKAVLALENAEIPPSLHFERPNPELHLDSGPFYVPTRLVPWKAAGTPRRAAVSSFGLGGTNAHAVLEEAPSAGPTGPSRPWQLLLFSARTEGALDAMSSRLAAHLREAPDCSLADAAYTLQIGRKDFPHRRMVLCRDRGDAVAALEAGAPDRCVTALAPAGDRPVVFLFPGQGSQYVGMGRGLYDTEPEFRATVDRCAELLLPQLGFDLRRVLYPEPDDAEEAKARFDRTDLAQPALFTVEYALARLLIGWGIRPQAMIGHSIGEYVAACVAGVFSLEEGLGLVAARGQLMAKMAPGGMLAVELGEPELLPLLSGSRGVTLALDNAPSLCVVAGALPALAEFETELTARGIGCRRLHTSHAFHSEAMDPVLEPFVRRVRQVALSAPSIPYVSNLTGRWITAEEATDPAYWARHLRSTVRFSDGVGLLLAQDDHAFLEVGPGRTLEGLVRRHSSGGEGRPVIATMRHPYDARDDSACLLEAIGRLWLAGACRKPAAGFHAHEKRRRVPLPTYPFERRRYWIDPPSGVTADPVAEAIATPPGKPIEDWFHIPVWRRRPVVAGTGAASWLVFLDRHGLGDRLAARLRGQGRRVATVEASGEFACTGDDAYALNPRRAEDYQALLDRLDANGGVPRAIVHLWSVIPPAGDPAERWDTAQDLGFHSLLFLVRAAGSRDLTDGLALDVVSSHMQPVQGDGVGCPEKATLLGLVRVAPKEFPGLRCRSIDLAPPHVGNWDDAACLDPLVSVLLAEDPTPVVAIRDGAVWHQTYAPRRLPASATLPLRLTVGGTWLITGGLGSMGLALARWLAREAKARLVLLGRTGMPADGPDFDPATASGLIQSLEDAAKAEAGLFDIDGDERLTALLRAFCAGLIGRFFRECGMALEPGRVLNRSELRQRLKPLPVFGKFLDFLLRSLADDGIVTSDGDRITVVDDRALRDLSATRRTILSEYPRFEGTVRLLEHCVGQYRRALSGEIPSISVLYPDGTPTLLDECGRHTPSYAGDGVYLRMAASLVGHIAALPLGRKLRILEVGGGSGGLTRAVLGAVRERDVEYTFTDLSLSFVRRAEREAAENGIGFIRFGVLDISRDAAPQGYPENGYDIVLGYNVVHATPDIEVSVAGLRRLLAPGGLLMLVETTRLRRWDEMVWGLTEGWWHFTDEDLRGASPLIDPGVWEDMLCRQGFDAVTAYPRDGRVLQNADTALLIARRPPGPDAGAEGGRAAAALAAVQKIEELGGEVLVLRADVADEAQMRAALSEMCDRFGPPDGVIHTAGILGQGLIHDRSRADIEAVFAPKANGLLVLDRLLTERGIEPKLMVLCSSLAAVAPIVGQVDYCAANAFLDAYAAYRTGSSGTAAIAIDWGFWQELGMIGQARIPDAAKQKIADEIRVKGWTGAGVEAFRRILDACPSPQVLVIPEDPEGLIPIDGGVTAEPLRHPWFDERVIENADAETYVSHLGTGHWVLDEHRPLGQAVLPGTAYLELARAALEAHANGDGRNIPVQLNDVYFLTPMVIGDGEVREVRTILKRRDAGFEFVVVSRVAPGRDEWLEHARGEIALLTAPRPAPLDAGELERRCGNADIVIGESGHPFAERVRRFMPHWRCFERLRLGDGEGLATLRLAPEFEDETRTLALHPALADMATGFLSMVDAFESGVPFCYKRVRLWHPLPGRVLSHVRSAPNRQPDERSYDGTVIDDHGTVLLDVAGFTLKTFERKPAAKPATDIPEADRNFCVEIEHPGSLATLFLRPETRRRPGPGEVEIEVAAAGINFIEVLYALGLLPEPPGGEVRFGLECAGTVAAVGEGVASLRQGDAVFGFAPRAFSRFTTVPAAAIAPIPANLSFAEAATLPAAYTTAYYALITRGRLRHGERVLIHSAAGGVGLAAVNIARWRGAEIFATAGSPEKRDYLRSIRISDVWDSRSLDFAGQVLDATEGRGVDVVLNSLGGAFIPASLSVLGRYGRFLELGKRDIFGNATLGLAQFEKHLSFTAIDVGPDLPEFDRVWRQVLRAVGRRDFQPLPYREFPVANLPEAFEHMAQGRHIGKLLVAIAGEVPVTLERRRNRGRPLADILGRGADRAGAATPAVSARPPSPATASAHSRPALATTHRPPTGPVEAGVVAIWEELLGVSGIGADDNFFELRGDSLLAAQVTSRLYAAFQVKLPLSSVFENPTAAGLAARIERIRQSLLELATAPATLPGDSEVEHEL